MDFAASTLSVTSYASLIEAEVGLEVLQADSPARIEVSETTTQCTQFPAVTKDRQSLLEGFEIVGADQDGNGPAVASDGHAIVLPGNPVNHLGESVLDVCQR
jgi:hypothetical protein